MATPTRGGLWEQDCEAKLLLVGFVMPDPEGWPSVFFPSGDKAALGS